MHVKSLFVRVVLTQPTAEWTCESRVSCWERTADCSSSSSRKERKCDSVIKGFSLFDPSPIAGSLLWLSICSLAYLCPRSQLLNPLKYRGIWGFSMSQKDTFWITLLFLYSGTHRLHKQQFSSLQDSNLLKLDYPFNEKTAEFIFLIGCVWWSHILAGCSQMQAAFPKSCDILNGKAGLYLLFSKSSIPELSQWHNQTQRSPYQRTLCFM